MQTCEFPRKLRMWVLITSAEASSGLIFASSVAVFDAVTNNSTTFLQEEKEQISYINRRILRYQAAHFVHIRGGG